MQGGRERERRDCDHDRRARSTHSALDEALIALDGTPTKSRPAQTPCLAYRWPPRAEAASRGLRYRHLGALYGLERFTPPTPMMNILNGGAHADTSVDFQEFMVMPVAAASRRGARTAPRSRASRHPAGARSRRRRRRRGSRRT
jgi:enolase